MTRGKKILAITGASLGGLILVVAIASYAILQSSWFANYVKDKIISEAQTATGGTVEIGRFDVDMNHLTIRIYDFVLHGTEAKTDSPLLRVKMLELHLRLFSGIAHLIDLSYLGIQQPQVNLISYADGKTNIPEPKNPSPSSNSNPLKTVVDLKIGQFNLYQGLIAFNQQSSKFEAHGDNLRVLLDYNAATPGYQGSLAFDPLTLRSENGPPLVWHVNIPVSIQSTALRVTNATLETSRSKIVLNASLEGEKQNVVNAKLNANLQLDELARSLQLPIHPEAAGAPKTVSAELAIYMDQQQKTMRVDTAHLGLGQTTFQLAGTVQSPSNPNAAAEFNGNLALAQLEPLLGVSTPKAGGDVLLNGSAKLDASNNYNVNGTINSRNLAITEGTTHLSDVKLYTPFHVDPYLISLDGLQLSVLGGSLNAKVFVEKMTQLSVEGSLRNFSIPLLAGVATGKHLGYDGVISGSLRADGNLKAKGTSGYSAQARLTITPGRNGVPVSGHLNAGYSGARDTVDLLNCDLTLPHSSLTLNGPLNKDLKISLVSRNLNDFLPAANFGAKQPETSLPVTLTGGEAKLDADIVGSLSNPQIKAHAAIDHFSAEKHPFDLLALDVSANPKSARVQNGVLTSGSLQASFDLGIGLRKWSPVPSSPLVANVSLRNGTLPQLLSLAGENLPVTGDVTADVHINGTYGNPLGSAVLQVSNGVAYDQPFSRVYANVNLADRSITLQPLEIASSAGTVDVTGTYQHPEDSFLTGSAVVNVTSPKPLDLSQVKMLQEKSPGSAGIIRINANVAATVQKDAAGEKVDVSNVSADVSARGLEVQKQAAGDLTLTAQTQNRVVTYQVASNFAGSDVHVDGRTHLQTDYPTDATFAIHNLGLSKVLRIAGESSVPVRGMLTADGHVNGTLKEPNADLSFSFAHGLVYQEPIDRLAGSVTYSNTSINIPQIALDIPAGSVTVKGSYQHPADNLMAGSLNLNVASTEMDLTKVEHVHAAEPTLAGTVRLALDVAARSTDVNGKESVLVSRLNANIATNELQLQHRDLGRAELVANTNGSNLNYHFDSDIAKSQIHLTGQSQLSGNYPTRASLTFSNIRYSNLAPFLSAEAGPQPSFEALVEGNASADGPVLDPKGLEAKLTLTRLAVSNTATPSPTGGPTAKPLTVENEGPVLLTYHNQTVDVQQFKLRGPATKVDVAGTVDLKDQNSPINVTASANLDLGILQRLSPDFFSSGAVTMDAAVHGSFSQPLVNGKLQLQNANVNYLGFPNGLSNGNGTILLTGTGAVIQHLTGQSGGGTITVTGFAGWTGRAVTYDVKASASRVRFRQSGISATANATITVVGNTNRSLVTGDVLVNRIAYGSSGDAGSILSTFASTPPSVPSAPSPFLTGMRLSIHVTTAPDLRVVTTYADKLNIQANLTVRGTAATPGILGRVTVTEGQLEFFGNTYTVNTGTINFYSATSIQPVVNFSLQTLAQGVNVTLGVAGPINNLQLTYRSDPPLTFQQIVQLLATNTTPSDPNIAASQPMPPNQSFTQMGESAVLGQAIADPLASRVQRVFGLSEFKIDPSVAGNNGQPSARVTLQQKIANNLIFTYITDVTQSNDEIIRIEWDLTPKLSAVGLRDFNGNVSLEMFYKFSKR